MEFGTIRIATILVASSFMATSALADDFNVSNQTKYELSFQVNGTCSQEIGKFYSHTIKNIAETTFINACKSNATPCEVKVYSLGSCQGDALLMVQYYMSDKFVSLHQYSSEITSGVSRYNLFLSDSSNSRKKYKNFVLGSYF